jgi:TPR repeat protein
VADSTPPAPAPATKAPAPAADPPPIRAKPDKADDAPLAKPTAAIKPAVKVDPVSEAQKYIYGRGVPQNCDRGMRLLKPAADQANPKAMIEMGALYSAGLCTPHDLPTAYRWFALALRKDPDNQSVQTDLSKLWGEMTQPERQLAIKLSQ